VSPARARGLAGECSIFVGRDPTPSIGRGLLSSYGKSVVHLGPVGRGMEPSLLNNLGFDCNYGVGRHHLIGRTPEFRSRALVPGAADAGSAQRILRCGSAGMLRARRPARFASLLKKDAIHAKRWLPAMMFVVAALCRRASHA